MSHRAVVARDGGRYDEALRLAEKGLELARGSEDLAVIASATLGLGVVVQERGELDKAETAYAEALERYRALGDRGGAAYALLGLGAVFRDRGDFSMLEAYCSQSLAISRDVGIPGRPVTRSTASPWLRPSGATSTGRASSSPRR